ncbi:MAG TPA: biotin/lipoyl-binding protein, partial [Hyphomicrobiaceae bacterium]|nr:biotin/lipoyl-binding protein [Hyphomicrobiaceae bacterium]
MAMTDVTVPDIGDFKNIPVIEILVKVGDQVKADDPLVTLESDKATMEVPAPAAGTVAAINVKVGDKVSEGTLIVQLESGTGASASGKSAQKPAAASAPKTANLTPVAAAAGDAAPPRARGSATPPPAPSEFGGVHASPSVRRL